MPARSFKTDAELKSLTEAGEYRYRSTALWVRLNPGGKVSFFVLMRFPLVGVFGRSGKPKKGSSSRHTIGEYGRGMTLAAAVARMKSIEAEIAQGRDPRTAERDAWLAGVDDAHRVDRERGEPLPAVLERWIEKVVSRTHIRAKQDHSRIAERDSRALARSSA